MTCKNIVLDNVFGENGMTEFKQIIGRGTRIVEDHGKMFFTILDFRNATIMFSDPKFNGPELQDENYDKEVAHILDVPSIPKEKSMRKMIIQELKRFMLEELRFNL